MRLSIITVVFNNVRYVEDCIRSVLRQTHTDREYIIVDGGSTDGTLDVIMCYKRGIAKLVSEPDSGIYDAMNKGIAMAEGDVVGFLNSDDLYADDRVLADVSRVFDEMRVESCYGNLLYVRRDDVRRVVRRWRSSAWREGCFCRGWHPPHPTFFVRRCVYERYGGFNLSYKIAADYELMLRFIERYRISTYFLDRVLVKMRSGGSSNASFANVIRANIECYRAWRENGLKVSPLIMLRKPLSKLSQYLYRTRVDEQ